MKPAKMRFLLLGSWISIALGQSAAPQPLKIDDVTVSGSLRARSESWDWFQGNADSDYTFLGSIVRLSVSQSRKVLDWQVEFAAPFLLGLPDDAIAPGAQGQLGLGASYFAANHRAANTGMIFAKQGFIRFKNLGGADGQSLRLGRMEFIDGAEVAPTDSTLATLKRERLAHRLIGNFGWSDVGRSFDGAEYSRNLSKLNLTLFGGRPTRGVFQVDGWGELNINVYYGAITGQVGGKKSAGEWRVFGLGYQDLRDVVLKTDNRPAPIRIADTGHINIGTFGGHYIHTVQTAAGWFDALAWVALQTGSWGNLNHRAGAFAAEAGWRPRILPRLKPWLRAGYDYGSGDQAPGDSTHGTFFQVLPTPRIYARFPFFNMMNNRDVFGELVLQPTRKLTVRSDVHSLRLASRNDLWYSGGGAFQPWTFGYTGRTSTGQSGLATLYDVSADYNANAHVAVAAYYGHAAGKLVVQAIYPQGKNANFGYLELTFKF
jgi:hypothetical protein